MTQHKTASPRDPWGPEATTPKLPCQLAEQPPCPALPHGTHFQQGPPAPQLSSKWGQQQGSCSLGAPRRCPVCPAAHPHCHALGSDQGGWRNPSLQELRRPRHGAGSRQVLCTTAKAQIPRKPGRMKNLLWVQPSLSSLTAALKGSTNNREGAASPGSRSWADLKVKGSYT